MVEHSMWEKVRRYERDNMPGLEEEGGGKEVLVKERLCEAT